MLQILEETDRLKKEIDGFKPLSLHILKQLKDYYRVGMTYASNALEGNSLTESETKIVLEDGITVGGKPVKDYYEALGHSESYDYMYELSNADGFTETDIKKLHKLFYYRIDPANAGKYRKVKVFISGSQYTPSSPEQLSSLMKDFINKLEMLEQEKHPVVYSALVHKELAFIHPFIDGNGRVARLLMNLALLQKGYCIAIIPPVLRGEYIQTLEKAHVDDKDFIEFIAQCVKETQKDYLRLLKA